MSFFIFAYLDITVEFVIGTFGPVLIAFYLTMKNDNCLYKISFDLATKSILKWKEKRVVFFQIGLTILKKRHDKFCKLYILKVVLPSQRIFV